MWTSVHKMDTLETVANLYFLWPIYENRIHIKSLYKNNFCASRSQCRSTAVQPWSIGLQWPDCTKAQWDVLNSECCSPSGGFGSLKQGSERGGAGAEHITRCQNINLLRESHEPMGKEKMMEREVGCRWWGREKKVCETQMEEMKL